MQMSFSGFGKYKLVYGHLWAMYGGSWYVRTSFFLQIAARICRLIFLPIALSVTITRLSVRDFTSAEHAVLLFVTVSLILGIVTPLIKYIGMRGENQIYRRSTGDYFDKLITSDLDYFNSNLAGFRTRTRELYKQNSGRMADVIANTLAVRAAAQEATYVAKVRAAAFKEADSFRQRYTVQAKLIAARELITVVIFLALMWLVVQETQAGHLTITAAILVLTYVTTILTGIYSLSDNLDEHDDIVDKIMPAFEILRRNNLVKDPESPVKLGQVRGDVAFTDVSFAYREQQGTALVFDGFSLHIPHGQKVGVVGLSGAGKSTLTKLLLRFEDVSAGAVTIDGVDVRACRQTDLRRQIAYVPQEPLLFHASIKDNVLLSRPDANERDLEAALKAAHAAQFIKLLPAGVDSIVGERGVKLSGGQKQRVAIARAVLQDAPIMILDEATSALDSESEQIIKDSFAEILRGKTAIVVAHRLSTLSEMDRIIVIEDGKVAEDGTHESLLRKGGIYAQLWKRQHRNLDESTSLDTGLVANTDPLGAELAV